MKLDRDPSLKYKKKLIGIINCLEQDKIRQEDNKKILYPTGKIMPRIFGYEPQSPQKGQSLRPIIDYTGSIGYNVSKSSVDIISPITGTMKHHVLNSK